MLLCLCIHIAVCICTHIAVCIYIHVWLSCSRWRHKGCHVGGRTAARQRTCGGDARVWSSVHEGDLLCMRVYVHIAMLIYGGTAHCTHHIHSTHTHILVLLHTYMHTYMHPYMHPYIHTPTNTEWRCVQAPLICMYSNRYSWNTICKTW